MVQYSLYPLAYSIFLNLFQAQTIRCSLSESVADNIETTIPVIEPHQDQNSLTILLSLFGLFRDMINPIDFYEGVLRSEMGTLLSTDIETIDSEICHFHNVQCCLFG